MLLSSLFIHGFLASVLHSFHIVFRTVFNVVLNISNPLSQVHINSIQLSHNIILFLRLFCIVSITEVFFYHNRFMIILC